MLIRSRVTAELESAEASYRSESGISRCRYEFSGARAG